MKTYFYVNAFATVCGAEERKEEKIPKTED